MIQELKITDKYYINGIPNASDFAPWQSPNLNSNTMRPDMTGKVNYCLNSLGYREVEFTSELLNNSVWCVGASDALGMGVDINQTWSSLLKEYGFKTTNLSIAGAGYDTFARVICSGLKKYSPDIIVLQSATPERREYITDNFKQIVLPSFPKEMLPHDEVWKYYDDSRAQYDMERNLNLIKLACEANNVKLVMFDVPNRWELIKKHPAHDNQHIGPAIHKEISSYVNNLIV